MQYRTISNGTTSFEVSTLCLGTMFFGTRTDTATSLEILDRFADAGGTFVDTANNYNAWVGGHGRDSEDVLGEWIRRRGGLGDVRLATKLGAAKKDPALPLQTVKPTNYQGLSAEVVAREARLSLQHLGIDRIDVLYGHVDDRETPLAETVAAFGQLQREGLVGISGISNVALWRLVEAREEALRQGVDPYGVVQQGYSYVYPSPAAGRTNDVSADLLDYVQSLAAGADGRPPLTITAYSPLHQGAFTRDDKPLWAPMRHASNRERLRVLHDVAAEIGATPNQVALAWLLGGAVPVIPVVGISSVAQLEEALAAVDLVLDTEVRARLDAADLVLDAEVRARLELA
ncbi:aldo/keto reductase [Microbacterium sp. B35-04]|uniref:aldo/keto reductase n=1 Tax=Microbacterium sp. B35-04 TaxID=1961716 RepID=UPI0013D20CAE|nr:aldo/keto reductase [Microbacterium sp. B35-04]KAF2411747.1 aldo/keto reductase [Microbacterium sp. B35-04]